MIAHRANTVISVADASSNGDQSANALKHGLTAAKCLPRVLQPGRLAEIEAALRAEYRPRTISEEILIREIARHAAALEVTEAAEPAVLRVAAQGLSQFAPLSQAGPHAELQLATAITTEPLDRVARYRRGHEKALHQAIDKLRGLQAARAAQRPEPTPKSATAFATETDCETYLQARFLASDWSCPKCGGRHGCWLTRRKLWQCGTCDAQIGLRDGTVFARSPLPLTTWFLAIRTFAANTSISARGLMAITGLTRPATARAMLRRIRCAIDEGDADGVWPG
jgi:hypothetical protein